MNKVAGNDEACLHGVILTTDDRQEVKSVQLEKFAFIVVKVTVIGVPGSLGFYRVRPLEVFMAKPLKCERCTPA